MMNILTHKLGTKTKCTNIEVLALSRAFYFITDIHYKIKVLHEPSQIPAWELNIYWFPALLVH